jgi:hypothetical protein
MKTKRIDKDSKIPVAIIEKGDKLIVRSPKVLPAFQMEGLGKMIQRFMDNPKSNYLIIPENFELFLLKKGSLLELEKK